MKCAKILWSSSEYCNEVDLYEEIHDSKINLRGGEETDKRPTIIDHFGTRVFIYCKLNQARTDKPSKCEKFFLVHEISSNKRGKGEQCAFRKFNVNFQSFF